MLYTACRIKDGKRFDSEHDSKYFADINVLGAPCMELDADGNEIFTDVYPDAPELVIFGGGHVAVYTAKIGALIGFDVTVSDDRPEFASQSRFPDAKRIICADFSELDKYEFSRDAYFVIATRGHIHDSQCLYNVLKRPHRYIGMIGSKKKVSGTYEEMKGRGVSPELLAAVHAPIGIDIGAKTPEEIAVSICAELIALRGRAIYCREVYNALFVEKLPGTLMTVIGTSGSSPGKTGAKAFLTESGKLIGTIGGGRTEYEAARLAPSINTACVKRFSLNNKDAADSSMICGGEMDVLFEKL